MGFLWAAYPSDRCEKSAEKIESVRGHLKGPRVCMIMIHIHKKKTYENKQGIITTTLYSPK